ncbi:hypothetical protein ISS30_09135 [bacterium]|nr:hypothetical protein [bacterium]
MESEDQFSFTCGEPSLPGSIGSTTTFYSELTNLISEEITVHLNLDTTGYPAGWGYSWKVGGITLPSFIFDWETNIQAGGTDTVTVNLIPNSMQDEGSVSISAYTLTNPSAIQELTFTTFMFYLIPTALAFPDLEIGCADSDWVYIVNGSGDEVPVDTVHNSLAVFSFDPSVIGAVVPANDSLGFWVSFAPEAAVDYHDTLVVESGGAALTVALAGTGLEVVPAAVQDLTVTLEGVDAVLNWSQVDTSIYGNPITVDTYIVFFSEIPYAPDSLYFFHGNTSDTTYTHENVAFFSENMFYQVTAYVGEIGVLNGLVSSGKTISREELRVILRRGENKD